ncbi:MAG: hypothetical protein IPM57_03610 [Oligoflexia bacterium]|nr:hypothetical protein [Oligoflexia bacterium]
MSRLLLILILSTLLSFVAQAKDVKLKWKPIPGAKKYKIQISNTDTFEKTIFEKTLETNQHLKDLKSGIYYLRVQAIDANNIYGTWSSPFKLVVTAPIKPIESEAKPESIGMEQVQTQWSAPQEAAPKYLVKVIKDGKEIETKQTSDPQIDFKPKSKGHYEVKVQAAFENYFGPPVTVKKYVVNERTPIKNLNSQKTVAFNWEPVKNAKKYKIELFKTNSRSPASNNKPYMVIETEDPKAALGKLPPGQYVASVSTDTLTPVTEYSFDIKKEKPVEFEKVDLKFHYNVRSIDYYTRVHEAGKSSSTNTVGGEFGFEANMQLSNSAFGLRVEGAWGNLLIEQQLISFNELKFSASYKWSIAREFYNTEITPFFGARAWSMPIVIRSGGSSDNNLQVLAPTFAGPILGFDVLHPLSSKWALFSRFQVSMPLTHSNLTNDGLNSPLEPTVNGKVELGVKYALKNNYRLFAMLGMQGDHFRYYTSNGAQGNNSSGETTAEISSTNASVGLEVTDGAGEFSNLESPKFEKFSEFDLSMRYLLSPMSYRAYLAEVAQSSQGGGGNGAQANPRFDGAFSGNIELETRGYFPGSKHGMRLMAGWGGYTYNNLTISYPEYFAQWAYRFNLDQSKAFRFNNYFGFRSWQVPIVTIDNSPQGQHFFSHNPQLLGLAETFEVTYALSSSWKLKLSAELSVPILATNRDSVVDKIKPEYMSYRADFNIIKSFSNDLSMGAAIGYKADRLNYVPLNSFNNISSTAELSAPLVGVFGVYSF